MATLVVAPGEYLVTKDISAVLETSLGSCIGVAVYDPVTRTGGMIHVLLPYGSPERQRETPWRFAWSGVPFLLSEMVDAGASRSDIRACVVGGATILVDSPLSAEMNIGRRNTEAALDCLAVEGVPVVRRETGGNFPWLLRLIMASGETVVERLGIKSKEAPVGPGNGPPLPEDLKTRIHRLKPIPEIARRILLKSGQSSVSLSELEEEVVKDQALAANVLKVCNSPRYGFSRQISSVKRALGLMGVKGLLEIVLIVFAHGQYGGTLPGYSIRKGELMQHSFCCALVAELIAREKGIAHPDVAFTAGLLHDIGKVVLDQFAFEKFNLIMDKVIVEEKGFLEAETEVLGFNHAQVGGFVARQWNLPEVLVEVISHHHDPSPSRKGLDIVSLVHLADSICSMFGNVCGADLLANPIHRCAITTIDLRKGDVERIVEKLPDIVLQLEMFC